MPRRVSLAIANAIPAGFDRHYGLFRYNAQQAKSRFERADWHGIRRLARDASPLPAPPRRAAQFPTAGHTTDFFHRCQTTLDTS